MQNSQLVLVHSRQRSIFWYVYVDGKLKQWMEMLLRKWSRQRRTSETSLNRTYPKMLSRTLLATDYLLYRPNIKDGCWIHRALGIGKMHTVGWTYSLWNWTAERTKYWRKWRTTLLVELCRQRTGNWHSRSYNLIQFFIRI